MVFTLETLLQQPESKTLEFKRDLSLPKRLLKSLTAFANTADGRLVIGVSDDGQLIGVDESLLPEYVLFLAKPKHMDSSNHND